MPHPILVYWLVKAAIHAGLRQKVSAIAATHGKALVMQHGVPILMEIGAHKVSADMIVEGGVALWTFADETGTIVAVEVPLDVAEEDGAAHEIATDEVGREEGSDYLAQIIALIATCSAGFWAVAKVISEQMLNWMTFFREGKQDDREFELRRMEYALKAQELAMKERQPSTTKIVHLSRDHYDEFIRRVREMDRALDLVEENERTLIRIRKAKD